MVRQTDRWSDKQIKWQAGRKTGRQKDGQISRSETDKQIKWQADRQTVRQTDRWSDKQMK